MGQQNPAYDIFTGASTQTHGNCCTSCSVQVPFVVTKLFFCTFYNEIFCSHIKLGCPLVTLRMHTHTHACVSCRTCMVTGSSQTHAGILVSMRCPIFFWLKNVFRKERRAEWFWHPQPSNWHVRFGMFWQRSLCHSWTYLKLWQDTHPVGKAKFDLINCRMSSDSLTFKTTTKKIFASQSQTLPLNILKETNMPFYKIALTGRDICSYISNKLIKQTQHFSSLVCFIISFL